MKPTAAVPAAMPEPEAQSPETTSSPNLRGSDYPRNSQSDCQNNLDERMGEGLCGLYTVRFLFKLLIGRGVLPPLCSSQLHGVDCDTYFCSTCTYAGLCDELCSFCTVEEAAVEEDISCFNQLDLNVGDGECAFYEKSGYTCEGFFCPTCSGAGYCDDYCGYC